MTLARLPKVKAMVPSYVSPLNHKTFVYETLFSHLPHFSTYFPEAIKMNHPVHHQVIFPSLFSPRCLRRSRSSRSKYETSSIYWRPYKLRTFSNLASRSSIVSQFLLDSRTLSSIGKLKLLRRAVLSVMRLPAYLHGRSEDAWNIAIAVSILPATRGRDPGANLSRSVLA